MITGRLVLRLVVAVFAVCAVCGVAATGAVAGEPTGEFAIFKECPRFTSGVDICLYADTVSGEVTIGSRTLPIERPLVLQGGIDKNEQTFAETFVGALGGETLSRAPQRVPGGLLGLPIDVTLELVSASGVEISVANIEKKSGTGVLLPLRIRLESPLLGGECYLGSRSDPIVLHLGTGVTSPSPPNKPISGKGGFARFRDVFELLEVTDDVMVDNTFSVPGATGCGGPGVSPLVDSIIDHVLGLPSPDGHNTIIENNTLWEGSTEGVIASEGG